jgi:hypothetical protein
VVRAPVRLFHLGCVLHFGDCRANSRHEREQ